MPSYFPQNQDRLVIFPDLHFCCSGCCFTNPLCKISLLIDSTEKKVGKSSDDDANLKAKDVHVAVSRGKYETRKNLQEHLETLEERVNILEKRNENLYNSVSQLERVLSIAIGWQCPDCQGELYLQDTGLQISMNCDETFPDRPKLDAI